MNFFTELKRRNVIRVGIAYVVVSWLVAQVAEFAIETFGAPAWVLKIFVVFLALGLPLVLVFAWAFELTPEGIRREKDVDRDQSITAKTGRKLDRTIIVLLVLALAYFAWDKFGGTATPPATAGPAAAASQEQKKGADEQATAIAVLPFLNMSPDPDQEYFSEGISEEILNALVRVKGLTVASRTSSFAFRGENLDIPQIARQLKVGSIVEGSVRKSGNRVRITAQLIDARSDRHLWSDTFDRELTDIFAIQDEIANTIVDVLKKELHIGLGKVKVETATQNLDAYDLYLKGRGLFLARQNLPTANQLLRQATDLDPQFATAWESLAASEWVSGDWLYGDGVDHVQRAQEAANKALELDAGLSMPYAVLGEIKAYKPPHDFIGARKDMDKAIANDPKNATAWLWSGIQYTGLGYMEKGIADLQHCLDIDPSYLNCKQHQAAAYLAAGETKRAMSLFEETVEANFHSVDGVFIPVMLRAGKRMLALYMANQWTGGTYAPVRDWLDALQAPHADHSAQLQRFERWAEETGQNLPDYVGIVAALGAYERLGGPNVLRGGAMANLWQSALAGFRATPYFKAFVRSNGMLAYWRQNGFPKQCRTLGNDDFECS